MTYEVANVAERIKSLRKSQSMTQEKLAEELHISTGYLQDLEGCRRNPSLDVLINVSSVFNVSIDYLLFGPDATQEAQKERMIAIAKELIRMTKKM